MFKHVVGLIERACVTFTIGNATSGSSYGTLDRIEFLSIECQDTTTIVRARSLLQAV